MESSVDVTAQRFLGYAGAILIPFGVVTSSVSIAVWLRLARNTKSAAVSVWAGLVLVVVGANLSLCFLAAFTDVFPALLINSESAVRAEGMVGGAPSYWRDVFPKMWLFFYPWEQATLVVHQWTNLLLSTERYLFFCQPFNAKRVVTRRRARTAVGVVVAFSVVASAPFWFEYHNCAHPPVCHGERFCTPAIQTEMREDGVVARVVFHTVAKYVIPWSLILLQTVAVCRELYRIDRLKRKVSAVLFVCSISSSAETSHHRKLARLSIAVVATFFVCQLPRAVFLAKVAFTLPNDEEFRLSDLHCFDEKANDDRDDHFVKYVDEKNETEIDYIGGQAGASSLLGYGCLPESAFHFNSSGQFTICGGWKATSSRLPQLLFYDFGAPLPTGSFNISFGRSSIFCSNDSTSSMEIVDDSCRRHRPVLSSDAGCNASSTWQPPKTIQNSEEGDRMTIHFDHNSSVRCFGILVDEGLQRRNDSFQSREISDLWMWKIESRSRSSHKNLAEVVFAAVNDPLGAVSEVLLLLNPIFDFVIFFKLYNPFKKELDRLLRSPHQSSEMA